MEKRGARMGIENCVYNLAGFYHFESGILAELKRVNCEDLEYIVFRMELTYDEIVDILQVNKFCWINNWRYINTRYIRSH